MCLPLLVFPCTIKSRSSLLAPAHPGGPGKRAVKWLSLCVHMCHMLSAIDHQHHQPSEAAADHPRVWSAAAADDVQHCLLFGHLSVVARPDFLSQDMQWLWLVRLISDQ